MVRSRDWRRWRGDIALDRAITVETQRLDYMSSSITTDSASYAMEWRRRIGPGMEDQAFSCEKISSREDLKNYTYIRARKHRDNAAICSCWACGNPSRSGWNKGTKRIAPRNRRANDAARSFEKIFED